MSEHAESDAAQELDDNELVQKKGGTSVVWDWFGFKIYDLDQKRTDSCVAVLF